MEVGKNTKKACVNDWHVNEEGERMLIHIVMMVGMGSVVLLLGLYFMRNIDHFMERGGIQSEKSSDESAIVFGEEEKTETICDYLENKGIVPIRIEEIMLSRDWYNIQYVIAVSDSDQDNITICNLGRKIYELKDLISICNEQENYALYLRAGIHLARAGDTVTEQIERFIKRKGACAK